MLKQNCCLARQEQIPHCATSFLCAAKSSDRVIRNICARPWLARDIVNGSQTMRKTIFSAVMCALLAGASISVAHAQAGGAAGGGTGSAGAGTGAAGSEGTGASAGAGTSGAGGGTGTGMGASGTTGAAGAGSAGSTSGTSDGQGGPQNIRPGRSNDPTGR